MTNRAFSMAVVTMALALSLASAGCAGKAAGAAGLPERGLAMIAKMDELASSEAYAKAMSASADLSDIIAAMGAGDYAAPAAVYRISVPADAMQSLMFGDESAGLSDELSAWIEAKACAAIPTQMAARSGSYTLAAASCVTYSQALMCKELAEPALYLYRYDGDFSAMVAFIPGQDGAVTATACFVPTDDGLKAADSAEAVAEWINDGLGYMQVTAEKAG